MGRGQRRQPRVPRTCASLSEHDVAGCRPAGPSRLWRETPPDLSLNVLRVSAAFMHFSVSISRHWLSTLVPWETFFRWRHRPQRGQQPLVDHLGYARGRPNPQIRCRAPQVARHQSRPFGNGAAAIAFDDQRHRPYQECKLLQESVSRTGGSAARRSGVVWIIASVAR